MSDKIKVLVVDDSSLVRKIITDILEKDPEIKVVGTANNGKTAIFKNNELNPDVITLDIEMPIMDGLSALKYIIETNPKPVIMMSVLTQHGADATFKALELGAVDFIPKPSTVLSLTVDEIGDLLISKVKSVYKSQIKVRPREDHYDGKKSDQAPIKAMDSKHVSHKIVGIGTSTGGPSALLNVFRNFPENFPCSVVVVQHMPEGFTKAFADRLNGSSNLKVKEAEEGDKLSPGCGFIAPGHSHVEVKKSLNGDFLKLSKGDKVSGHRPSIDVLFNSIAETYGKDTVAVIMTGMGRDGATGIQNIRKKGGFTIAQDEATSVVFGMNKVAINENGINDIVPLQNITMKIVEHI